LARSECLPRKASQQRECFDLYSRSRSDSIQALSASKETPRNSDLTQLFSALKQHVRTVDRIIKEDKVGLDLIYVQAKRWDNSVGRPTVQAFAGSLEGVRARKGVLITTSTFTADALDYVQRIERKIVLIDGKQLADLMIEHDIGVAQTQTFILKRLDSGYFDAT
jgi:predicted helicase